MRRGERRWAQTLVQKILRRHVLDGGSADVGEFVSLRPRHVLTHDNSFAVIKKFREVGAARVYDPSQLVFALDHDIQNTSEANLDRYRAIGEFAEAQGIDFYPAGRGIGHQIMVEELYAEPGSLCVASDSHSNMYGGVGCLGTPVVRTDACALWATGRTWWRVPPVVRVELRGRLPEGCSGKDVIIALCGFLNEDEVLNHAVEFAGDGVASLSIEDRLTIANMSTEWGALCGLFPVDEAALDWWAARAESVEQPRPGAVPLPSARARALRARSVEPLAADEGATYAREVTVNLAALAPLATGGNTLKAATAVAAAERTRIHKAWLLSCVNARAADIAAAAAELRGASVAEGTELFLAAASSEVQSAAEAAGDWQVLVDAGARVLPPGCGACAGLGSGTIAEGEVGVASTNRNFQGRMGSRDATVYLASPATVAASAREGYLTAPRAARAAVAEDAVTSRAPPSLEQKATAAVGLVPGMKETMEDELVFCNADNISTDGIYHGRHMYEDLSPARMAEVAMENYDPNFSTTLRARGTAILVAGANFGTGSSREQAAQALQHAGVAAVIAASFSATYTRNALNNGLPVFESPELVAFLRERCGAPEGQPTALPGLTVHLDLRAWQVRVDGKRFPVVPLGHAAQELLAAGGLEAWIRERL